MNCPNCGMQVVSDQQFCRSCGAGLASRQPGPANQAMLWGLLMAFGGIVIALLGKMLVHIEIITLIGVLISVAGIFFIAAYPFLRTSLRQKFKTTQPSQESLANAETTKKLLPINDFEYIPSVTEATTNLLKEPVPIRSDPRT